MFKSSLFKKFWVFTWKWTHVIEFFQLLLLSIETPVAKEE